MPPCHPNWVGGVLHSMLLFMQGARDGMYEVRSEAHVFDR
jgi:hypothetical protein